MQQEKVDVAVQSYKKPESLIYTLLSLKKHCQDHIACVYIDDDQSGEDTIRHYQDPRFIEAMAPIQIKIRVNKKHIKPAKFVYTYSTEAFHPFSLRRIGRFIRHLLRGNCTTTDDIRYQWAIDQTTSSKLLIIHDDIQFNGDVIAYYLNAFAQNPNLMVVGPLGQCNICAHVSEGCNPAKIMQGKFPSKLFPRTAAVHDPKKKYERACRINEWCCMIDVAKARKLTAHFGNCVDGGDTAAYWFEQVVKAGYDYLDPHPTAEEQQKFFLHCWQGHSGHSVWQDQGWGIQTYKKDMIKQRVWQEFGYRIDP